MEMPPSSRPCSRLESTPAGSNRAASHRLKPLLDTVAVEPRGQVIRGLFVRSTGPWSGRSRVDKLKSAGKEFEISKRAVWEDWGRAGQEAYATRGTGRSGDLLHGDAGQLA